ncbi:hypothetical protein BC832DRAFT_549305 [Gaertneriomyces semiglobifer]|nr:hypothetical protein BC832DRAFT_549305 [Gaertneriomyces semiglobifer]
MSGALPDEDAITHPSDWPSEWPAFRGLDESVRCIICKDYYRAAMILPCFHTFCSLCVRNHLGEKMECPTCRSPMQGISDLRPNRAIDEVVRHFKEIRSFNYLQILSSAKATSRPSSTETFTLCGSPIQIGGPGCDQSGVDEPQPEQSSRYNTRGRKGKELDAARQQRERTPVLSTSEYGERMRELQPGGNDMVQCPICQKHVKAKDLNRHLDSNCLTMSSTTDVRPRPFSMNHGRDIAQHATSRRPKTSAIYSLLSEQKIRKLLKVKLKGRNPSVVHTPNPRNSQDDGLPTHGDKNLLSKRHAEWVKRFNANLDDIKPKSDAKLIRELAEWERAITTITPTPFSTTNQHENTPQTEEEIRRHKEKYDSEYQQMIAILKKRKREKDPAEPIDVDDGTML